jgi:uncharacterized protein YjiS (DUF1127 family)
MPWNTVAGLNTGRLEYANSGPRASSPLTALVTRLARSLVKAGLAWHVRRKTITALEVLDDDALDDIGLHRSDIPRVARDSAETYTARRLGLVRRG